MAHVVLTSLDHIKHAQRGFVLVGGIDADFQASVRHFLDGFGKTLGGVTENREVWPPGFCKAECEGILGERLRGGKGCCHSQHSRGKNRTDLHCSSILLSFLWVERLPFWGKSLLMLVHVSNYR